VKIGGARVGRGEMFAGDCPLGLSQRREKSAGSRRRCGEGERRWSIKGVKFTTWNAEGRDTSSPEFPGSS